jgi:hypothetical protein
VREMGGLARGEDRIGAVEGKPLPPPKRGLGEEVVVLPKGEGLVGLRGVG